MLMLFGGGFANSLLLQLHHMGPLIFVNDIFNYQNEHKLNRKSTPLSFLKSLKMSAAELLHLNLEEVGEARLHGRVGLPAVTHNAKEPKGGRTQTSEELRNCHVEELPSFGHHPPHSHPPPHLPLTAF